MQISHLLFDADGVLQTWLPGTLESLRSLPQHPPEGVSLSVSAASQEDNRANLEAAFLQAVFVAEAPCLRGEAIFAEELEPLLAVWGVRRSLDETLKIWRSIKPYPGMFALIKRLQNAGVKCHLATNQHLARAAYMRQQLGYDALFDRSYYSCDMGVAKPSQDYFRHIVKDLNVAPETLLFVDDKADNVAAAQAVGLHGLQFEARNTQDPEIAFMAASKAWKLPAS